jgi:hypothetical protein
VAKPSLQRVLNSATGGDPEAALVKTATKTKAVADGPKVRQIHKEGEVNISAYFPAEVKASLRMVQAKTGNNVKECLAEALRDLFRKHNVPISVGLGEGR